ncbi:uncharacterized protein LOC129724566 [Wyeomyia smithii]|uniref:uncharacterized protein LOC129724566 n=1 Tax=Wyeomyia smithii TaxID=174621 RepID=UPI0024680836|nr:uncharacterized protein LOC129724566 [Wyeomyia smithii]
MNQPIIKLHWYRPIGYAFAFFNYIIICCATVPYLNQDNLGMFIFAIVLFAHLLFLTMSVILGLAIEQIMPINMIYVRKAIVFREFSILFGLLVYLGCLFHENAFYNYAVIPVDALYLVLLVQVIVAIFMIEMWILRGLELYLDQEQKKVQKTKLADETYELEMIDSDAQQLLRPRLAMVEESEELGTLDSGVRSRRDSWQRMREETSLSDESYELEMHNSAVRMKHIPRLDAQTSECEMFDSGAQLQLSPIEEVAQEISPTSKTSETEMPDPHVQLQLSPIQEMSQESEPTDETSEVESIETLV